MFAESLLEPGERIAQFPGEFPAGVHPEGVEKLGVDDFLTVDPEEERKMIRRHPQFHRHGRFRPERRTGVHPQFGIRPLPNIGEMTHPLPTIPTAPGGRNYSYPIASTMSILRVIRTGTMLATSAIPTPPARARMIPWRGRTKGITNPDWSTIIVAIGNFTT